MLPFRRIAGFFARLLVIYGLFAVPWPGIKAAYAALYSAGGNLVFGSLIPGGSVRFNPASSPAGVLDTDVHFVNLRSGAQAKIQTSSRSPAYLQTAFLASLVLATPLPWRRRLWALLWGLILVNVAIACSVLVAVLHTFSGTRLSLLTPTPPWDGILPVAAEFAMAVLPMLMVPVFIWIVVSFRRTDWVRWVQMDTPPAAERKVHPRDTAQSDHHQMGSERI